MFLYEIIYFSEKSEYYNLNPEAELQKILEEANRHNEEKSITGMLFSSGKYFFQILEGRRSEISNLMFRISGDRRHRNVVLVRVKPISARRFVNWSMCSVDIPLMDSSKFRKYATGPDFEPREFSEETIDLFLMTAYTEVVSAPARGPQLV